MNLRKRGLGEGWYPGSARKIAAFLGGIAEKDGRGNAVACVVPHAGWYFSGELAARGMLALDPAAETLVVFGGHLGVSHTPLYTDEDGVETPLGVLEIDGEFREELRKQIKGRAETGVDNTVEVGLPMIKYFFPKARLCALRLPAAAASFDAGRAAARTALSLKRRAVLIGSTDLTHYGPNYGFTPRGLGEEARDWVKNHNDAAFIAAVLRGDAGEVLARAGKDASACSPGAVLGAMGWAAELRAKNAELLAYTSSADIEPASSFVGYGVFTWTPASLDYLTNSRNVM